ncbi:MAG: hypothetical protein R3E91_05820 [Chlamydiales bacterium]
MRKWLLILYFLGGNFLSGEIFLKNKLVEADIGSYIVTEQNKNFTLFYIREKFDRTILIEEVTIPARRDIYKFNWKVWFENGAPGHTSWTISYVNLDNGQFEGIFSFNHNSWIQISDSNSFLTTLLNLPFNLIPEENRRRIGSSSSHNKSNYSSIWHPFLTIEGQRICIPFTAWHAYWPSDGTHLANKCIEIYLPEDIDTNTVPDYPTYFPYWIGIEGKVGSMRLRVVDSGKSAKSPKNIPSEAHIFSFLNIEKNYSLS